MKKAVAFKYKDAGQSPSSTTFEITVGNLTNVHELQFPHENSSALLGSKYHDL